MSVYEGQLRKWHHTVEGQSDFFVAVRRIGHPRGRRGGPWTDHWDLLHDGQISTGWPEDLIEVESIPCSEIA